MKLIKLGRNVRPKMCVCGLGIGGAGGAPIAGEPNQVDPSGTSRDALTVNAPIRASFPILAPGEIQLPFNHSTGMQESRALETCDCQAYFFRPR